MKNNNNKDQRKEVVFFKLGGAWAAIPKGGNYLDRGVLDTEEIYSIEKDLGFFTENADYQKLEWKLAQKIYERIVNASKRTDDLYEKLSFIPDFSPFIKGKYIELY